MEGRLHTLPRTVEEIFNDWKGRRDGIIKALTTDKKKFFQQCDPERENLCLFGFPDGTWEVKLPIEEVPPDVPEPALAINFARDRLRRKEWLSFVALHSDSWLHAVAYYLGGGFRFDKSMRERLFDMINELPTIHEVVTGVAKPECAPNTRSKTKSSKRENEPLPLGAKRANEEKDNADDGDDDGELISTPCGVCGDNHGHNEFWICCDTCKVWFHGECVKITPAKAAHIEHYRCSNCKSKEIKSNCWIISLHGVES